MNSYVKSLFIILILTLTSISFAQFAGGDGSPGDPYQVETPDHLYQVRFEPFASFIQVADIDFSTSMWSEMNMMSWEPIGNDMEKFIGTYDGDNYKILNLYINEPSYNYMGLFGYLEGATLQNIIILDANVTSASNTGAVAGNVTMSSSLQNCSSSGIIQGVDNIGGLVGNNSMSSIVSSYSVCNVQGGWSIGGLVGYNDDSPITNSYALGTVSGEDMTGGLLGGSNMSDITNCYSTGTTNANIGISGGLIGFDNASIIADSYWDMETSGCPTSFGGEGRLTVEMKMEPTFMNWDFITPIWNIDSLNSGYPYLAWSIPQEPVNPFAGGNGSEFDPYQIGTAEQLNNVRDHLDSYFIQIADIDLEVAPWNEGEGWVPIGDDMEPFAGFYNGDYYTISNLFIDRSAMDNQNTGLFGYCDGQMTGLTIENVILDSVNIDDERHVGALVGLLTYANILNCSSSGTIVGEEQVGGLIGLAGNYSNITGCYSSVNVTAAPNIFMGYTAGGLIGELYTESSLTDCYATGEVLGENGVGGLVGHCGNNPTITNCYSIGFVAADQDYEGGLVGFSDPMNESNCYWDMDTSGQDTSFVGTGKTYTEMHEQSTYETWDFTTVWQMDPQLNYGYPYLAWSTPSVNNTPFAGGDGSESNPYLVATPTQLDSVRNYLNSNFKQISDINLTEYLSVGNPGYNNGEFWLPIGENSNPFIGNYNGNFKVITGLSINRPSTTEPCGLFGYLDGYLGLEYNIENIYINNTDSEVILGEFAVGTIAGFNHGGIIYRCYSNSIVSGEFLVGGLVGNNMGFIEECCSSGEVTGDEYIGGLVGEGGGEYNSYSKANVTGNNYVGGLVGNGGGGENCYSIGYVDGGQNTGGLTGYSASSSISCYWDIETSGQTTSTSGIGKTSTEMKDIATFDHFWDFTTPIWEINQYKNDGYPYLSWQNNITYDAPKLTTSIQGSFFVIEWDEVPSAIAYKIYTCDEPYGTYTLVSQEPINSYGCPYDDRMKFFYIVAVFSE